MNNLKTNKTVENPKIRCNECGHEFKLKPSIVKLKKVSDNLDRTYFKCPKCKHEYTVIYQDQEVKDNLLKMAKLREAQTNAIDIDDNLKRYDNLYKRNLSISKSYKDKYDN